MTEDQEPIETEELTAHDCRIITDALRRQAPPDIKTAASDFALAAAGAILVSAAAWRPGTVPAWLGVVPLMVLVVVFTVTSAYQLMLTHVALSAWRAWRRRED